MHFSSLILSDLPTSSIACAEQFETHALQNAQLEMLMKGFTVNCLRRILIRKDGIMAVIPPSGLLNLIFTSSNGIPTISGCSVPNPLESAALFVGTFKG